MTRDYWFRGSIHLHFQLRALGTFLAGLGIIFLPFLLDAIPFLPGAGIGMYIACFVFGLILWALAWSSYHPWRTPARVTVVNDRLVFHHPSFAEPLEIARSRIRVAGVDVGDGPRFPLLDPVVNVPVRWLSTKDRRFVPYLRWDPVVRAPNVALLFSGPLKLPRRPFLSDGPRVIKGDAPIYGLMFTLREPREFLRRLDELGLVRPMKTNDLPVAATNVIQPGAERRLAWVGGLVALTALVLRVFLWLKPDAL